MAEGHGHCCGSGLIPKLRPTNDQKSKTWLWLKARLAVCILPPGPQSPEVSPSPSQRAGCPPCRRLSTSSGAQHSALSRLPRRSPGVLCTWPPGSASQAWMEGSQAGRPRGGPSVFRNLSSPSSGNRDDRSAPSSAGTRSSATAVAASRTGEEFGRNRGQPPPRALRGQPPEGLERPGCVRLPHTEKHRVVSLSCLRCDQQ